MDYSRYKKMDISQVGMGCYALSGAYGGTDISTYKKVLLHARKHGVNYFDTAPAYGPKAERILGKIIKPDREEMYVSTKVGMKNEIEPILSYEHVISSCENSLRELDTDYIDFYFVHYADINTPIEETLNALQDLQSDGKIVHYGISHLSQENASSYFKKGNIGAVMMELSPVARSALDTLLPICRDEGIAGIAFSVTGRGVLTGRYNRNSSFQDIDIRNIDPLFKYTRSESALRIVDELKELGKKYDKTPVQIAIRWVLSQPGIVCALTGPSKKEHLEENIGGSGWEIYHEDMDHIDDVLKREDDFLDREEPRLIKSILSNPLPNDSSEAISQLVYVLEVAAQRNMAKESQILPIFQKLWSLKKEGADDTESFESIKGSINNILNLHL